MNMLPYLQLFWYYPFFLVGIYTWTISYQRLYQLNPIKKMFFLIEGVYKNLSSRSNS